MSNEQSLRELKIFRERSCNGANHQSSQQKLKKGGVYLKSVFFILKKFDWNLNYIKNYNPNLKNIH